MGPSALSLNRVKRNKSRTLMGGGEDQRVHQQKYPARFPEKFTPNERAKRDLYSYLPFGAGPRNCLGRKFALMEIKVCFVYVIAKFRIHKRPKTKVPLEFNLGQQGLLQPKKSLTARKSEKSVSYGNEKVRQNSPQKKRMTTIYTDTGKRF
ncbi:cytochrome P450 3A11 [Trichonephila inaurata madagascariensis]|uniref:Cytochrome P450 3A11 n=1 Tax=Trichonephila inaurata madagascariensis TaxID=2747483 RepID=A0A8X6XU74_9ARAC|nr:cytochrome P450 3A11 [Trichonephila inaurata madagascariensis]